MAANDKCKALEILQNEVQSEDGTTRGDSSMNNRLFVNPDFVQDLDQSDGSKQFDNENEEEFGDAQDIFKFFLDTFMLTQLSRNILIPIYVSFSALTIKKNNYNFHGHNTSLKINDFFGILNNDKLL